MTDILKIKQNGQWVSIPAIKGDTGEGVPTGGTTGQVLAKASGDDYDTEWITKTIPTNISDLTDDTSTNPIDKADTLTGLTATVEELNVLDGITATTTELNQLSGVTSNIQTQLNNKATSAQGAKADTALQQADILNVVNSTATNKALSANMGKELQDQITHLKSIGRFLALWNCSTGLAQSNPTVSPYDYKTGDYFLVGTIAGEGGTNYRPDGTQYVIGTASTTEETEVVEKGYIYWFDSTNWNLMQAEAGTVTDVQVDGTSVVNNGVVKSGMEQH